MLQTAEQKRLSFWTDRDLWSKIRTIILPISLQGLLMHIDTLIDQIMLGQVGQNALASVSLAGQVQFIYNMLMSTVGCAFSIFVAQYWGKRDTRTVEKLIGMSIQVCMTLSLIFFLLTFCLPTQVMRIFTDKEIFLSLGGTYLRYIAVSYFALALAQGLSITCRCTGHAKALLWISCATVPLDIIFNYVFIYGIRGHFAYGVAGAAIATVIVRTISLCLIYWEFRREHLFRIRSLYIRKFAVSLFQHVAKYTYPILGNYACYGVGVICASIIIGHQSTDAVAANSVTRALVNASCIFFSGISGGVSVIIGNQLGAGNLVRAKDLGQKLLIFSMMMGILSVILLVCFMPYTYLIAKLTPEAEKLTRWMLFLSIPSTIGKALNAFFFTVFNTGGQSKISFRLDLLVTCGIVVPFGLLSVFVFHAPVLIIFFIVYADEMLKAPVAYFFYRKFTWLRDLTERRKKTA